jgi:hypothetical protein
MVWNANKEQVISTSLTSERKPNCQSQVPSASTFCTLPFVDSRSMGFWPNGALQEPIPLFFPIFFNHLLGRLLENSDYIKTVLCDQRL